MSGDHCRNSLNVASTSTNERDFEREMSELVASPSPSLETLPHTNRSRPLTSPIRFNNLLGNFLEPSEACCSLANCPSCQRQHTVPACPYCGVTFCDHCTYIHRAECYNRRQRSLGVLAPLALLSISSDDTLVPSSETSVNREQLCDGVNNSNGNGNSNNQGNGNSNNQGNSNSNGHGSGHTSDNGSIYSNARSHTNSLGSSESIVSPNFRHIICEAHDDVCKIFCEVCGFNICTSCFTNGHSTHKAALLPQFSDAVIAQTKELTSKIQTFIVSIGRGIDHIQQISDNISFKARNAENTLNRCVKRVEYEVRYRQIQLSEKILQASLMKRKTCEEQIAELRSAMANLLENSAQLSATYKAGNGCELMVANEKISRELLQLQNYILPRTDDNVTFFPPPDSFFHSIRCMGAILTTVESNPNPPPNRRRPFELNQGRPIFGLDFAVTVQFSTPQPSMVLGGPGQLCRPWGACCDKEGKIYVTDRTNNRIQIFTAEGNFFRTFGSVGQEPGQFFRPAGIAIDRHERIIVADKDNHRIQIFHKDYSFLRIIGERGSHIGQFIYPFDVATNYNCEIVVSDGRNRRVQLFSPNGDFIKVFGPETYETPMWKHTLDTPRGVCFTPSGNILVTDFNNHRIVELDNQMNLLRFIGSHGRGSNRALKKFHRPQGILCDDLGNVVVADSRNLRIQVLDLNSDNGRVLNYAGLQTNLMPKIESLCLTPGGKIVTVDKENHMVFVF